MAKKDNAKKSDDGPSFIGPPVDSGFKMKKDEHAKLKRAATMYTNLTGESIDISGIPIADEEKDPEAEAQRAKARLEFEADATRKREEGQRAERQARKRLETGDVQPENPGPGQPAMVTERAKAQGASRAGDEPDIAGGSGPSGDPTDNALSK